MTRYRHHTARRMFAGALLALACLLALGSSEASAAGAPTILEHSETFEKVGPTEAIVHAQYAPEGLASSYRFEYGPTSEYGSATAPTTGVEESGTVDAQAVLSGLQPETEYHFRVVATDTPGSGDTADGPDFAFTTAPITGSGLPDGRIYEMVSPPENNGADIYAPEGSLLSPIAGSGSLEAGETPTEFPFQASLDGNSVAYVGDPSFEGNGSGGEDRGNEYLATRTTGSWRTQNITPLGYTTAEYVAFSPDLSLGILAEGGLFDKTKPPLSPHGLTEYQDLYLRTNSEGQYRALFTETPKHRSPEEFGWLEEGEFIPAQKLAQRPLYAGASIDFTHVLFEADDALTGQADAAYRPTGNNLYDSIEGEPISVNVLPDGKLAPDATFGGYLSQPDEPPGCGGSGSHHIKWPSFSHVISEDGSRIFWTDLETGDLYVRENDATPSATTALISEGGEFWTANSEGSEVFFTKLGELYEYDVNTAHTIALAPSGKVEGVVGTSEDGEYVYFVAAGVLAAGENVEGDEPIASQPNLYLLHGGTTSFIATLSGSDDDIQTGCRYIGDWWPNLGGRTAMATPSGQDLVFESVERLTGYDNRGLREVYVYDAVSGRLSCASCKPTGETPSAGSFLPVGGIHSPTYQPQLISDDGSHVFFETAEALTPRDTNNTVDVYEWERDDAGSCRANGGCLYLLSGGSSPSPSYFVDASASGDDVFFVTRAQLVPQDGNNDLDLYDAHVGGVAPPTEAQCTGTGCQGAPFAPPPFEAPSSLTFDGIGNFPPLTLQPACTKGYAKKRGKCVKVLKRKAKKPVRRRRIKRRKGKNGNPK